MTFLRVVEIIIIFISSRIIIDLGLKEKKSNYNPYDYMFQGIGFVFLFISTLSFVNIILLPCHLKQMKG